MTTLRTQMRYLNPYELHKLIINEYVLKRPGDTKILERDKSKDRTDFHILKDNHRFLWDDSVEPVTWEEQFAKKYYQKLFKEYCIADLTRYKENKVALRWRIEREVVSGKGQFICGNKACSEKDDLRSWEVNFAYQEQGQKKNALIKIRLCPSCSKKLNYHSQKREIKRLTKKLNDKEQVKSIPGKSVDHISCDSEMLIEGSSSFNTPSNQAAHEVNNPTEDSLWNEHKPIEAKSRDEEMEDYLQDLLV